MKKIIVFTMLFIICVVTLSAQGSAVRTRVTKGDRFYVASLPKTSGANYQKLKIEITGGNYFNDNLGTRLYSISTRNGNGTENLVRISQEQRGGATSFYVLKVYETADAYDFIIESTEFYLSIFVQAWLTTSPPSGISSVTVQEVKNYTNTNSIDVTMTNQVEFINIYTTDNVGNIGIGVTSPKAKLDVNGIIRSKEVKIEATGWSDFVFNEDYKLPSLKDLDAHIKNHRHLPDIPSENEVLENGINVGEIQAKLLQKIEELTLYVIEQDKKYDDLKKENDTIKQELKQLKQKNK